MLWPRVFRFEVASHWRHARMPSATVSRTISVALIGNPNTGKSTLFTALAGVRQRTGNYPGVTVEKRLGQMEIAGQPYVLVDLPGTYSLAPRSPDEMVAVDVLLGRQPNTQPPDAVLCIVDASNLERNLYLVSQVLSIGLPTVVALNMMDLARQRGVTIDTAELAGRLGAAVVEVQANQKIGLVELRKALVAAVERGPREGVNPFPAEFQREVAALRGLTRGASGEPLPAFLVERLLLDTSGYLEHLIADATAAGDGGLLHERLAAARARLSEAGLAVPAVEALARYEWVGRALAGAVSRPAERSVTLSDGIDRVLTHRVWGTLIFAAVMLVLFSSVFIAAEPLMSAIDGGVGAAGAWAGERLPEGALRSLLVDGAIAGVGSVVVFLPQILILFLLIAVLEDCGYMARAAYLMDKLMVRIGLSGKSFIPLLSSFACAVPGIMATRVIENRRDRLTTILVAPLMSCSARLPVYLLLIGAFIPPRSYWGGVLRLQGLTLFAMYLIGIVVAAAVALCLKRTLLRGATPPFVMELPPYKFPSAGVVAHRMFERGWVFLKRAGTLIFSVAIVIWAMLYYPRDPASVALHLEAERSEIAAAMERLPAGDARRGYLAEELAKYDDPAERENLELGAQQRQSALGRLGRGIEPVVRPLGWDWRIGCAALASFPAREVVLGTLGVIYNLGPEVDLDAEEGQTQLQTQLRNARWDGTDEPVFNIPVAMSIMVFFALCAQCAATLAVIKRETNSVRWPLFTFVYMTGLAYLGALLTYQIGMRIG